MIDISVIEKLRRAATTPGIGEFCLSVQNPMEAATDPEPWRPNVM